MDTIKILLGISDNIPATFFFYMLLGFVIASIYYYKSYLEVMRQSYTTKDGNNMTHEDVIRFSRKYGKRVYDIHPSCPLLVAFGLTMHNMILFFLPGAILLLTFESAILVVPHFLLYLLVVTQTINTDKEVTLEECRSFAENYTFHKEKSSSSRKDKVNGKKEKKNKKMKHPAIKQIEVLKSRMKLLEKNRQERLTKEQRLELEYEIQETMYQMTEAMNIVQNLKTEKVTTKLESSKQEELLSSIENSSTPYPISVVREIALDDSLLEEVREEAYQIIRDYEKKRAIEEEQARNEDARISLQVAKQLLS